MRALTITTSPVTLPFVPGVQGEAAMGICTPVSGSTSRMPALPRSHPTGISHGSSRTFSRP